MDIIFEILFDLIMEGSIGAVGDKKVPLALRIIAAVIVTVIYGGLVGVFIYLGIVEKNILIILCGVAIAVIVIFEVMRTVKKHRGK
ncbi:hypothetical protein SAMN04487934_11361 [Eubacterium ruminantium]|nr:hypothetical protein SAMN04487934_11361 [Eubacterium ruminantium]